MLNDAVSKREHFNLFYIFLEDKQSNLLSQNRAAELLNAINLRTNRGSVKDSPPDG